MANLLLTDKLPDWLIDWLADLLYWVTVWLAVLLIEWLNIWLTYWWTDWLAGRLTDWLTWLMVSNWRTDWLSFITLMVLLPYKKTNYLLISTDQLDNCLITEWLTRQLTTCWPTDICAFLKYIWQLQKVIYLSTSGMSKDNIFLCLTALHSLRWPTDWLDTCDCLMANCLTSLLTTVWSTDWLLDNCLMAACSLRVLGDQLLRMKECLRLINWLIDHHRLIDSPTDWLIH